MTAAPYVLLSCAMSVDGYIDDTSPDRLRLSDAEDYDRVDALRAESDAILIGAATMRRDNPRLLVNSPDRRATRVARGLPEYPLKVTLTSSGDLDPDLEFWHHGGDKAVYCPDGVVAKVRERLGDLAIAVGTGQTLDLPRVLADLTGRGIGRLMVEGGSSVHTQFLTAGLADELQLAIAPFFVGEPEAPRFVGPGSFANDVQHRMTLAEARTVGDVAVLRYLPRGVRMISSRETPVRMASSRETPSPHDARWLSYAVELSRKCPPSTTAYNVGAVIVDATGVEIANGYSRDTDPRVHAEESALSKLAPGDARLNTATLYSTLEPCTERHSRAHPCAGLIIAAGIRRVVIAWREPSLFVADCQGVERLREAGVAVVEIDELARVAKAVNRHLPGLAT